MGFNGNTNDAINESFTNDSLGQTSVRTVTEVRNSSGVPIDPATSDNQELILAKMPTLENNGGVPVNIQDQTTESIDMYLCKNNGTTNPTNPISLDDKTITVDSVTGAVIGDCIDIKEGARFFQGIITDITGSVISFASPVDYAFTENAIVYFGEWDLAQANGSVTPVTYYLQPPANATYDIYSITISITDNDTMDDSKFGGITQLTNGLVGRIDDGYTKQLFLISNNAGFREYGFDIEYPTKVPAGIYAISGKKNYHSNNGVALRIDGSTDDTINVIVQDNLTGLSKFAIVVHGHIIQN